MHSSTFYPSQDSLYIGFESRYNSISEEPGEEDEEETRICVVGDANKDDELISFLSNYGFHVVYSEKGVEYRDNEGIIFVITDFESPDFKYLNSISKLILGPAIIRFSVLNNLQLPRVRPTRPIYCCSMKGMRFSLSGCTNQESRRAVDLIHFMSGSARKNYTPGDTLIAKIATGEKYRTAVNLEQPVLTLEWIEECWRRRDDINFIASTDLKLQSEYRIKCFQGLKLYFAGFPDNEDLEELKRMTVQLGGTVVLKYENASHSVCAYDLSARLLSTYSLVGELPRELSSKIKHVSREWFWKSVHMEQCALEELYSANGVPSRPLQSRENVINRKRVVGDSLSPDNVLRINRKNNSKVSLDNLENSNNSSALPEHMYSSDNLDQNKSPQRYDRRYQISMEMLETEENYLRMLQIIINLFKKPLEAKLHTSEELLSKKEISMIFSKIPALIEVHINIRNNLNAFLQNWHSTNLVGKVWADGYSELKKVYPSYISSYDEAVRLMESCDRSRPKFHSFLRMAESNPDCQKNSIKDMLIRPVQRIPSVVLLLQELFKRTDKTNVDFKFIKIAIERLKDVLQATNDFRRQTEMYERFMETCQEIEDLPPDIVSAARELVQAIDVVVLDAGGVLQKLKSRTISLFLFNDIVVIAKCRFVSSALMNSTLGSFGGSGTIKERSTTLGRQISFTNFRQKKERKPYKYIYHRFFSAFRTIELVKSHGVFIVKIRDEKADELCFFQLANGTTIESGIEFFENLIRRLILTTNRDIALEELTVEQLQTQCNTRPEEYEAINKALSIASELTSTGIIRRPSQLRRAVSNVSLGISSGLHRFTSRSRLSNIGELK